MKQTGIYPNHVKGYNFECELRDLLVNNGFTDFESNNLESIQTWYRSIGKGADFKFHINGKQIEAENKFLDAMCYLAWVLRDYITRFSYAPNTVPIVVCNNIFRISQSGREELKRRHIKIMNQYQFIWYLFKVSRRRGNKYVWYKTSIYYNINDERSGSPEISTDFTTNTIKIKPRIVASSKIKNHSLNNKNTKTQGVTGQIKQTTKIQAFLNRILLMASILPFLNYFDRSNRKLRNKLFFLLTSIHNEILALTSPLLHMKHYLRLMPKRCTLLEHSSIQAMNNNTSSALCSITPYFSINASSFEFYHTGTSGVPWLQEYMHRLN